MEKPILATDIDELLIKHEAFIEPHRNWFKRAIEKTGDNSLKNWMGKENYFLGVNEAMKKIMPSTSKEERTRKAREWYQKDVIEYVQSHPEVIKREIANKLISLKKKYKLILITTNTIDYINKILKVSELDNIYDFIIASKTEEEPNKERLIEESTNKYGKPKFYLTGKPEDSINKIFEKLEIKVLGIDQINEL